ncbi:sigma-70 family RNA polymerase sigma factor [Psychrosphaera sp. F3M07]|uniref:RNA polymerase sigma factor n=1 Tax=Psychrosphaera sp. F3M07 TaxID=2841560 RepID=UPI001C0822E6|nr:sigma-70 family RNA polymerase sigma factor [Psychrosphaera sp. F3M07]MBU2918700.1 sigma-70 family RNA polymerase sigma factor [Psychrosphaera sp. F3M07]
MSIFRRKKSFTEMNDVNLVISSLGGDRDAFCQIVSRYQNLLCSLAYSSVGDVKHSEDIAQETFIEAWKSLDSLKEPAKLKSWLCGILRFKVSRYRRKENTQPIKNASEFEEHNVEENHFQPMDDLAIREQEQNLLWKTLDQMDDTYREPLILFYREQQSVERVATELDLSLDTTKQRLSRGRKLLKRAMISFVEDTLSKSKPGVDFTASVISAISLLSPPAKAALLGTSAAKGGSMFKISSILVVLASFSGVVSSYFGVKAALSQSRTTREKKQVILYVSAFFISVIVYVIANIVLKRFALLSTDNIYLYSLASQLIVLAFILSNFYLFYRMFKQIILVRMQERILNPGAFHRQSDQKDSSLREYKSKIKLFGAPLFHFQFGTPEDNYKPAYAWVAGGSKAYGLLFAWGGLAVAPISVGIVSFGIVTVGSIGIGLIGIGTVGIGLVGMGASAIAYKAYGAFSALGWESALSNGFSIANDAAIGPIAHANLTNTKEAAEIINLAFVDQSHQWFLAFIAVIIIIPAVWHSYKVQQRMQ